MLWQPDMANEFLKSCALDFILFALQEAVRVRAGIGVDTETESKGEDKQAIEGGQESESILREILPPDHKLSGCLLCEMPCTLVEPLWHHLNQEQQQQADWDHQQEEVASDATRAHALML